MYNILIVGTGYVGTAIGKYFSKKRQKVIGLVQSQASCERLEREGIHPFVCDLTKPETLEKIPPAHFIVLSPAPKERSEEGYRAIYMTGIGNFLRAIQRNPRPFLIVYLSSTAVYGEKSGAWVDEDTPATPDTERGRILLAAERQVYASGFSSVIFRLAGIYGPGRNRIQVLREGKWALPMTDRYLNMIHVEDIVGAMVRVFKKSHEGHIYLGCDDEPVRESEFYRWLCERLGMDAQDIPNSSEVHGKRCANARFKALGYALKFQNYRAGYEPLLYEQKRLSRT